MRDDEFYLITPTTLKGVVISPIIAVVGLAVFLLSNLIPRSFQDKSLISFIGFCMIPLGVALFGLFTLFAIMEYQSITRFRPIKKIVVSGHGISLYRKDGSIELSIPWQQIIGVQIRELKYRFLGLIETHREPTAITFNLAGGSSYIIPIGEILKEQDRLRMVSTISRYIPTTNLVGANSRPTASRRTTPYTKDDLYRNLLAKVRNDDDMAKRLIDYERKRMPNASQEELIKSAIERWERDNG